MDISFKKTNGRLDELIEEILSMADVHHPKIIREMVISALKTGQENDYLADLKMLRSTMKEMRYTSKMFSPYRERKKVTIFGSARTAPSEESYKKCVIFLPAAGSSRLHGDYRRWPWHHAGGQRGCRCRQFLRREHPTAL